MYRGFVTEVGRVVEVGASELVIAEPKACERLEPGASIAVAGVCASARSVAGGRFSASISTETARRSTLDELIPGARVNIELPVGAGDKIEGHLVQGHVDGVGKVVRIDEEPSGRRLSIRPPERFFERMVAKGSVAVDGVSLTVAEVSRDRFSVALVPTTLVAALPWAGHVTGRLGGCAVVFDPDREREGDVIAAGAMLTPATMTFILTQACSHPTVPCDRPRLDRLEIPPMPGSGDHQGTAMHVSVDLVAARGTGVSAEERAATIRRLAHPEALPSDFLRPGHVFPLAARPGGLRERPGHTEATMELCRAAKLPTVGVCCEVMSPDGQMAGAAELERFALYWQLPLIEIADLKSWL